jgi:hypothetical protein
MTWICDIPGADAARSAWHFALHVGLATFVVGAGILFLTLAVIAYRRPVPGPANTGRRSTYPP